MHRGVLVNIDFLRKNIQFCVLFCYISYIITRDFHNVFQLPVHTHYFLHITISKIIFFSDYYLWHVLLTTIASLYNYTKGRKLHTRIIYDMVFCWQDFSRWVGRWRWAWLFTHAGFLSRAELIIFCHNGCDLLKVQMIFIL